MEIPFIRLASSGDEAPLHEAHMRSIREVCIQAHTEDEIRGWGNRPLSPRWTQLLELGTTWVVEWAGEVKGVAHVRLSSDSEGKALAHIYGLYLTPEVLGKGFGSQLLMMMVETARSAGAAFVTLDSSLNAHDFYKRHGFTDTGPMKTTEIGGSHVRSYPMSLDLFHD